MEERLVDDMHGAGQVFGDGTGQVGRRDPRGLDGPCPVVQQINASRGPEQDQQGRARSNRPIAHPPVGAHAVGRASGGQWLCCLPVRVHPAFLGLLSIVRFLSRIPNGNILFSVN